jgi:lysophospholipase L1-like esterase
MKNPNDKIMVHRLKIKCLIGVLLALMVLPEWIDAKNDSNSTIWTGSWATAPQVVEPNNMPPAPGLTNNTIRPIVRVSIGGNTIRLRFSNIFSHQTVTMKLVTIALAKEGSEVDRHTLKPLKFAGKKEVIMQPGTEIKSDPLQYKLPAGSRIAITIAFAETSSDVTGHPGSRTTSYLAEGNQAMAATLEKAVAVDHWYVIQGIEVQSKNGNRAIAILGNSITDGRGSGTNKQNRWSDVLSEQLLKNPSTSGLGVLNLGIGGNCVVRGGLGQPAVRRFDRDILGQSNVHWLIILEGVNDIGGIRSAEDAPVMVSDLIATYNQMINKAHAKGIKVYGATILPFAKSFYDKDFRLAARDSVNAWIRTGGRFDAVIDFDKRMRDPANQQTLLSDLHTGDYLHPNETGYRIMGECVDLELFK